MTAFQGLYALLAGSADRAPDRIAVEEREGAAIRYGELLHLAGRLSAWLDAASVEPGDRVGIYLHKTIDSVASIFGILARGAAYVPIDPLAPMGRNAYILHDCKVKALVVERQFANAVQAELGRLGFEIPFLILDSVGGGRGLDAALVGHTAAAAITAAPAPTDLAYVLYTSGSTGLPKGVMLSHENARCFIDWCSDIFQPSADDRFSSHAPFHFDLSILDIYVPLRHGATLVLIGEQLGKDPPHLAEFIAQRRVSIWYSAPSILRMLVEQGQLDAYDWSALRLVLFAGEVFPVKHLRAIKALWPHPRYFNLFGPTETNVCTWYEVPPEIPPDRTDPYPIGKVCGHYRARVVDQAGTPAADGSEGELCIAGPGIMQGYWNLPDRNAEVFIVDPDGTRWYRTGDVVLPHPDGNYRFLGRRDRMIKKRGYRVELGEIEAALYRHPDVKEAAVIASTVAEDVHVRAFVSAKAGGRLSIIALKQFCARELPLYMVPDTFTFFDSLPKTSTDKVDYQALKTRSPA